MNHDYEVAVIGAGHAGIEAALASSRLGSKTVVFSINLDSVGNCPCSPSIGGTAKGTLVREIDAIGGEMAKAADECFLHSRILNTGKGAAVQSIRAQIDREKYKCRMKHKLETQENLHLKQAEIISLERLNELWVIKTRIGTIYKSKCVILASGTYLRGRVHIGEVNYESGPDGVFPSNFLTNSLEKLRIPIKRFKTGTPARILKSSIDFSALEIQKGDEIVTPFSYDSENIGKNKIICHIARTNNKIKEIILKNIHRSPMYKGEINGIGPRYCPSIEDKVMRFIDKESHQIFVEPCGVNTEEIYLHGMSSSMPQDVQTQIYRTVEGFENAVIMRFAYAIEYDIIDPFCINPTLEFKFLDGLYSAGQVNGTSGYEEAAAQGLVAGINAALRCHNKEQIVLSRSNSYIGTLIDDLVIKGVDDPYRMLTSRSEYRLFLRIDNADERLMPIGRKIGLINDFSWSKFELRMEQKNKELTRLKNTSIKPTYESNKIFSDLNISCKSINAECLLKYPDVTYGMIKKIDKNSPNLSKDIVNRVEIEVKYEGYIKRQVKQIEKTKKMEKNVLPKNIDYFKIKNLSLEAREKLTKTNPLNLGQASRISGVTPADISVLMIWIEKNRQKQKIQDLSS
ncbi:MAG: tRNA uridine-5-carboxymethylaminomethyl(34) synthesis enzyme MnmG [Oscillospiraceae bacterium]|jgi:tRNA uridine 5-carboxymethylaminomethyl modification enzyme|nr:tRNA uridine-5-carboxymethylaminomethyl(34) synthesis enzyme MnmG [Oscillospiraceae bacterium]